MGGGSLALASCSLVLLTLDDCVVVLFTVIFEALPFDDTDVVVVVLLLPPPVVLPAEVELSEDELILTASPVKRRSGEIRFSNLNGFA